MISYPIGNSGKNLIFSPAVLEHFRLHRQRFFWQCEAGGQLYARARGGDLDILEATGPRRTDRRSPVSYQPDRSIEQSEINSRFAIGLHFVGDWHTHPQNKPVPSTVDIKTTSEGVRQSHHHLNAFVMVIVGKGEFPESLYVSVNDGEGHHILDRCLVG